MFDESGEKVWEAVYDIYGKCVTLVGKKSDCPFRYQGQYEDVETGLYYNRFRYYDCQSGQYVCQDPLGLLGGIGFYKYTKDTLLLTDPLGLVPTYLPLDNLGRPTGAFADLTHADLRPTGSSPPTVDPPGWISGDHPHHQQRSHLIADTLGGSGSDRRNLVALTDGSNHPGMSTIEGSLRRYIRRDPANNRVLLEVTPIYTGNSLVPDSIRMYALDQHGNVLVDQTVANGQRQNTACHLAGRC